MAEIRHALQHEVLQSCDERLLAFVNVSKAFKKKKTSILCISVTKETPFVVNIYQVTRVNNLILNERSYRLFYNYNNVYTEKLTKYLVQYPI